MDRQKENSLSIIQTNTKVKHGEAEKKKRKAAIRTRNKSFIYEDEKRKIGIAKDIPKDKHVHS